MSAITLPYLFNGHVDGGLHAEAFLSLSAGERLGYRLSFIADRATMLGSAPYSAENGIPANIHKDAQRLSVMASSALELLESGADMGEAMAEAFEVGLLLQSMQTILAAAKAIEINAVIEKDRTQRKKGAKKTNQPRDEGEKFAREEASKLVAADERMELNKNSVLDKVEEALIANKKKSPNRTTLWAWLTTGESVIPEYMRKPGRPKKE